MDESGLQSTLRLEKGKALLEIMPQIGGAVKSWRFDEKDIFYARSDEALTAQSGVPVAAYPLVPYSNRIAEGRFSFGDEDYQLAPNMKGSPHPIHGNGWENAWKTGHKTESHAILFFDFKPDVSDGSDLQWPFAYRAALSYTLFEKSLEIEIVLENRDTKPQPVGIGFHPFLCADPAARLSFSSRNVWLTQHDGLPEKRVAAEGTWSFGESVSFYDRSLDNVFTEFGGDALLKRGDGGPSIKLSADPVFSHLVVFSPQGSNFVALEPVSMMTDGFNHPEIADRGVRILKTGERFGGKMRFTVSDD